VSGKGSGRVSVAGLVCFKPGARGRFFYRLRLHRGRKGERHSMSEDDYASLITRNRQPDRGGLGDRHDAACIDAVKQPWWQLR